MKVISSMIHPELRRAGRLIRFFLPRFTPRIFRAANRGMKVMRMLKGRNLPGLRYEQIHIPRADGSRLRLCVYSPPAPQRPAPQNVPGLLWIHGGGYAMGAPEQDTGRIRSFVQSSGCLVVSPDYRLSGQAPYPAALEDCYAALLWLRDNGSKYGARPDQLMVGGGSAGGGLTAALSLYARDRGEVAIAFQMPLYPMLDDRMDTASAKDNDGPLWNSSSSRIGWEMYLGELFGKAEVPAYAAPARAGDFSGLPPACAYVGEIDPFRDETAAYVENLRAQGIPVHFRLFEGCFHGFNEVFPRTAIAKEATAFLMDAFRYAVGHYFAPQPKP